ncbi:MAG: DUF3179 domain-containing protein [Actinomycetota bacterium]|nr:DUF3179 domain-containing protein [Actinomycetota bacterium]
MTYRILRPFGLLLLVLLLGLVTACGGSDEPSDEEKVESALAEVDKILEKEGPLVGLGEADVPPPDATQWKTDFSKALVPLDEIQSGGPPKDGIPPIDAPKFTQAEDVDWLEGKEPVIALEVEGETRAYPLQILTWHEIVNDEIGSTPVAVTFCPLCNTAIVFDRRVDGDVLSFGTTGKLRDSDLVMYDRQTESWWQQFGGKAIVGELAGKELRELSARIVSWDEFRSANEDALVLNRETGHSRDYGENPYPGYDDVESSPLFATRGDDDKRLLPKERVVYVEVSGDAFAVPFSSLAKQRTIEIETDGGTVVVRWRPGVASALDEAAISAGRDVGAAAVFLDGEPVPFSEPFWFAVAAFRPDIEIVDN